MSKDIIKVDRIEYFDPNNLFDDNSLNSGVKRDNISVNQEDLSMYVNLMVRIPSRYDTNANNGSSIFSGTKIKNEFDGREYNFLTDSFVNASYTEIKNGEITNRELFGIKSIDVSFDVQFFPQVTIEFTDVRGYSLMGPIEHGYMQKKGKMAEEAAGDFFKSLFHYPYPMFSLQLKGFYGPSVSFDLAVSEFNSSFDSNSGDFNITVKFVGHMYGLYADIPTSYVLTSPYFDFDGNIDGSKDSGYGSINGKYWTQKVKDKTFCFPEYDNEGNARPGNPIPTYVEFISKYSALITPNQDKLNELAGGISSTNNLKKIADLKQKISVLSEALIAYSDYKSYIEGIGLPSKNGNHVLLCLTKEDLNKYFGEAYNEKLAIFNKKINDLYSSSYEDFGSSLGRLSEKPKKINENHFFIKKNKGKYELDNNYTNRVDQDDTKCNLGVIKSYVQIERTSYISYKIIPTQREEIVIETIISDKNKNMYLWENEYSEGYGEDNIKWCNLNMTKLDDKDVITKKIEDEIHRLEKEIKNVEQWADKEVSVLTEKILGFTPTVENIYRMLFAHLDTFVNSINDTVNNINPSSDNRKCILGQEFKTDVKNENIIPPFPMVSEKNNGKYELIYPGEISLFRDEPEINLVEKIYTNVKLFSNKYNEARKELELALTSESNLESSLLPAVDFIPLLYHDFSLKENPYSHVFDKCLKDDYNEMVKSLIGLFAIRLAGYVYTYDPYFMDRRYPIDNKILGEIEAINFYKKNPNVNEYLMKYLLLISDNDFYEFICGVNNSNLYLPSNTKIFNNGTYVLLNKRNGCIENKDNKIGPDILLKIDNVQEFQDINKIPNNNVLRTTTGTTESINECYDGEINNSLLIYPLDDNNYNTISNVVYSDWAAEKEYGKHVINVVDMFYSRESVENFNIDKKIELLCSENDDMYSLSKTLLLSHDNDLFVYNKLHSTRSSEFKYGNSSCISYLSLIFLIKIGCLFYHNIDEEISVYTRVTKTYPGFDGPSFDNDFQFIKVNKDIYPQNIADNLKQLYKEWVTGEYTHFKFLENVSSFKSLVKYAKYNDKQRFEVELNKLSNCDVLAIKTVLSEKNKKHFNKSKNLEEIFNSFKTKLKELYNYDEKSNISNIESAIQRVNEKTNESVEIKKSIYYTIKTFYDKWFYNKKIDEFRLPKVRNRLKDKGAITDPTDNGLNYEFNRMEFVDSYLSDISRTMIVDMNSIKSVIDDTVGMNGSATLFETMHNIASKNRCLFLTVPVFNNTDMKKIFEPHNIYNGSHDVNKQGSKYVVLFPGDNSKILDLGSDCDYLNDSFDIANLWGDIENECKEVVIQPGFTFKAFGVTHGKQNQNYFKSININMDNPTPTDYSIANVLKLAEGGKNGDQNTSVFLNNSLYPILANRTYSCTVEMMGDAAITPLMYFQLNNIPMFRGAYVITNVSHKIVPGDFTTTFTGVRIPKYNMKPIDKVLNIDEFINRCGVGGESVNYDGKNEKSNSDNNEHEIYDTELGNIEVNNNESYSKEDIENIKDEKGRRIVDNSSNLTKFDDCKTSLKKFVYDFANDILDYNKTENKDLSIIITSTFRGPKYKRTSHHNWGFAVDIQGMKFGEGKPNREYTREVFSLIINNIEKYYSVIDSIIWETHQKSILGGQNKNNAKSDFPNVIHVSTCNKTELDNEKLSDDFDIINPTKSKLFPRRQVFQSYIFENSKNETIHGENRHPDVIKAANKWDDYKKR